MKTRLLLVVTAILLVVSAFGCARNSGEPITTVISGIPVTVPQLTGTPPANPAEAPDDIVFTPGGSAYRANVHEQGVPDKWPEVETVEKELSANTTAIFVRYREIITTKAGEVRNNLFDLRPAVPGTGRPLHTVLLYTVAAPPGMSFYLDNASGLAGPATVLVIDVPSTVARGRYTFAIIVVVDGVINYGSLGCTVDVTK